MAIKFSDCVSQHIQKSLNTLSVLTTNNTITLNGQTIKLDSTTSNSISSTPITISDNSLNSTLLLAAKIDANTIASIPNATVNPYTGILTANGFKVGTSTGFLKADGTIDNNAYSVTGHTHSYLSSISAPENADVAWYYPVFATSQGGSVALGTRTYFKFHAANSTLSLDSLTANGSITVANSITSNYSYVNAVGFKTNTASTGFLKADGTVDNNAYSVTSHTHSYLSSNQNITISGDATGSGTTAITLTLANTLPAPVYINAAGTVLVPFMVDIKGRVIGTGTAVTISPPWTAITSIPAPITSIAGQSTGTGFLKLAAGVASLDSSTYLTATSTVTAGTGVFAKLNYNAYGQITGTSSLVASDFTGIIGGAYLSSFSTSADTTTTTAIGVALATSSASSGAITYKYTSNVTITPSTGTITAGKFVYSTGTSAQFLKADGSVDSNAYSVAGHTHLYAASATAGGAASSVANALSVSNGITFASGTSYNGSAAMTLSLSSVVTAGTGVFAKLNYNAYGQITGTSSLVASDFTPYLNSTYAPATGSTAYAPATGSTVYAPISVPANTINFTGGYNLYARGDAGITSNYKGFICITAQNAVPLAPNLDGSTSAAALYYHTGTGKLYVYNPITVGTNTVGWKSVQLA